MQFYKCKNKLLLYKCKTPLYPTLPIVLEDLNHDFWVFQMPFATHETNQTNQTHFPEQMSARQRAAEITSILAAAIVRTHASGQAATDQNERQVGLGFVPDQRVHENPYQPRSSK